MAHLTLRQIEAFRAVMLTGGVSSAADLLHVSQPAISKVLAQIRRATGLELFESVKGRLLPTPEAQQLFAEVETLWRGLDRLQNLAVSLARPSAGYLRLAVSTSVAPYLVPRAVMRLLEKYPGLKVHVETVIGGAIIDAFMDGSADLGVAVMPPEHPSILHVRSFQCALACIVPSNHRLAKLQEVCVEDLHGERMITSSVNSLYGQMISRALGSNLSGVIPVVEVRNSATACWFVQAGAGVALVDRATVAGNRYSGTEVITFVSSEKVDIHLIRNGFKPMSSIERAFCSTFEEVWESSPGLA